MSLDSDDIWGPRKTDRGNVPSGEELPVLRWAEAAHQYFEGLNSPMNSKIKKYLDRIAEKHCEAATGDGMNETIKTMWLKEMDREGDASSRTRDADIVVARYIARFGTDAEVEWWLKATEEAK